MKMMKKNTKLLKMTESRKLIQPLRFIVQNSVMNTTLQFSYRQISAKTVKYCLKQPRYTVFYTITLRVIPVQKFDYLSDAAFCIVSRLAFAISYSYSHGTLTFLTFVRQKFLGNLISNPRFHIYFTRKYSFLDYYVSVDAP